MSVYDVLLEDSLQTNWSMEDQVYTSSASLVSIIVLQRCPQLPCLKCFQKPLLCVYMRRYMCIIQLKCIYLSGFHAEFEG